MKALKILGITLLVLGLLTASVYFFGIKPHFDRLEQVAAMPIGDIDPAALADGVYMGEFSYNRSRINVTVTIEAGLITAVNVFSNRDSEYIDAASAVAMQIVSAQSLQVDLVSGATRSSKAILKSVENALKPEAQ